MMTYRRNAQQEATVQTMGRRAEVGEGRGFTVQPGKRLREDGESEAVWEVL